MMKLSTLCYIERGGCYLMLHRVKKQHDVNEGKWIGVGGKLETDESPEECIAREVMEETGLKVTNAKYLFSLPNVYRYSGLDVQTLDLFFACEVEDQDQLQAMDDAAECLWLKPEDIHTEQFGLRSVRQGLYQWLEGRP